jgi:hypothetical protein
MMRPLRVVLACCLLTFGAPARANDSAADSPVISVAAPPTFDPLAQPNSVYLFAGPLSTRSLGSTLRFNRDWPANSINYDNNIAGLAFNRDLYRLGLGFTLGAEIGVAERFGRYTVCCDTIVAPGGTVHSTELWIGPRVSFDGFVLFNAVRIAGAVTWGFSFADSSIGREREREIRYGGNARALLYFGPEIVLSLAGHPEWELVYRVHHRSGANGTFGKMHEGYNANVFGLRYRF